MSDTVFFAPADRRALVIPGLPADNTYSFEVRAYRKVDPDVALGGVVVSPPVTSGNYQPTSNVAFNGNIEGTIQGRSSLSVVLNLEAIASDAILSTTEKPGLIIEYNRVADELAKLDAKAATFGSDYNTERAAAATAKTNLDSYLNSLTPAWNDSSQHTSINSATFRSNWDALYQAVSALSTAITGRPGAPGAPGPQGPTLTVTPDKSGFTYVAGALNPASQTITFSAKLNGVASSAAWSTTPNIKSAASGSTFSISNAEMGANQQVVVTATVNGISVSQTLTKLADPVSTPNPVYKQPTAPTVIDGGIWYDGVEDLWLGRGTNWERAGTIGARLGTNLRRASGSTLGDAQVITGEGISAGFLNQGALATKNAVDLATAEVLNKSLAVLDSAANAKLLSARQALAGALPAQFEVSNYSYSMGASPLSVWPNLADNPLPGAYDVDPSGRSVVVKGSNHQIGLIADLPISDGMIYEFVFEIEIVAETGGTSAWHYFSMLDENFNLVGSVGASNAIAARNLVTGNRAMVRARIGKNVAPELVDINITNQTVRFIRALPLLNRTATTTSTVNTAQTRFFGIRGSVDFATNMPVTRLTENGSTAVTLANFKTGLGVSAGFLNQGALSTKNTIAADTDLSGLLALRLQPSPVDSSYLSTSRIAWDGGSTVESLKPQEAGSNKTETRVAAGFVNQGALATKNAVAWSNEITGIPTQRIYRNLLDASTWVVGSSGSQPGFYQNGTTSENTIVIETGPSGSSEVVWKSLSEGNNSTDGGWDAPVAIPDAAKSYRSTVFVMQSSTDGAVYLGCSASTTNDLAGAAATNPYFWSGDLPETDKWYLLVGIIHGSGYTGGNSGVSGVYDPVTGRRVILGQDYKNKPGATTQVHRVYQYYTSAPVTARFARPRFDLLDGNEPTLESLMKPNAVLGTNLLRSNGTTVVGDADAITNLGTAAAISGQSAWATYGAVSPATMNVRTSRLLDADGTYDDLATVRNRRITRLLRDDNSTAVTEGAVVTSLGTAAAISGQGFLATQNYADWATRVTGAGRPSDNAGTSGILLAIGQYTTASGNSTTKTNGTHGAYQGGVTGAAQRGGCYISSSVVTDGLTGGGWVTTLALDNTLSNFDPASTRVYVTLTNGTPGSGLCSIYLNAPGAGNQLATSVPVTSTSRLMLLYDEVAAHAILDGVVRATVTLPAGLTLFPKSLDYFRTEWATPPRVEDIQYGPARSAARLGSNVFRANGTTSVGDDDAITNLGTAAAIAGQGPGATAPGQDVLNYSTDGSQLRIAAPGGAAYRVGLPNVTGAIRIDLPQLFTSTMLRFEVDIFNYVVNSSTKYIVGGYNWASSGPGLGHWVNAFAQMVGSATQSLPVRFGSRNGKACIWIGDPSTVWQYPTVRVSNFVAGFYNYDYSQWDDGWAVSLDTVAAANDDGPAVLPTITNPRASDAVFGVSTFESVGGATATLSNFKTLLGTAAAISNQAPAATDHTIEAGADVTATAQRTIVPQYPVIEVKQGEAGHTGNRTVTHAAKRGTATLTGGTWSLPSINVGAGSATINSSTGTVTLSGIAASGAYTVRYTHTDGAVTELPVNVTYVPAAATGAASAKSGSSTSSSGVGNNNNWTQVISLTLSNCPAGRLFFNKFGLSAGTKISIASGTGTCSHAARLLINGSAVATLASQPTMNGGAVEFFSADALFNDAYTVPAGTVTVAVELQRTTGTGTITAMNNKLDCNVIAS